MKSKLTILIISIFFSSYTFTQEEFEVHLSSIDSTFFPGHPVDDFDSVFNANRFFVDYVITNNLINDSDIKYISNRKLLNKFKYTHCDSNCTVISDTLKTGEICEVFLRVSNFKVNKHLISRDEESNNIILIDKQKSYGAIYNTPAKEIAELVIKINGEEIVIPNSSYLNLYNPNICDNNRFFREIEVYSSIDGMYIYVYIYGGDNSETYFSKLVFDKKKYITKIIADYNVLSMYSSFRSGFIGF